MAPPAKLKISTRGSQNGGLGLERRLEKKMRGKGTKMNKKITRRTTTSEKNKFLQVISSFR